MKALDWLREDAYLMRMHEKRTDREWEMYIRAPRWFWIGLAALLLALLIAIA